MKLAIIGYGNVGRALARLLREKRKEFPFTITGIHTLRHGTAVDAAGLPATNALVIHNRPRRVLPGADFVTIKGSPETDELVF